MRFWGTLAFNSQWERQELVCITEAIAVITYRLTNPDEIILRIIQLLLEYNEDNLIS